MRRFDNNTFSVYNTLVCNGSIAGQRIVVIPGLVPGIHSQLALAVVEGWSRQQVPG